LWSTGDVFVGVGKGTYKVYTNAGVFRHDLVGTGGGLTTGGAFQSTGDLYATFFTLSQIQVFDRDPPHGQVRVINTAAHGGAGVESLAFDASGDLYAGHARGDRDIKKYTATGTFLATFDCATGPVGSDWIDLLIDQRTIVYSSRGRDIRRFDVVSNSQLANLTTLPGAGQANALRVLPPFDLSRGLIVADGTNCKRLDSTGAVVQVYDAPGEDSWFAMDFDPNGTSFWAANSETANFYRFDFVSGAIELGPINTGTGSGTVFGLVVMGEITCGRTPPRCTAPAVLQGTTGNLLTFDVSAVDDDLCDVVTLGVAGLPPGAVMVPPLPLMGNPVASQFRWTPSAGQVGRFIVVFTARDRAGIETVCRTIIDVTPDCLLMLSGDRGQIYLGSGDWCHVDPGQIFFATSVLANEVPAIDIPDDARLKDVRIYGQVMLYNAQNFPSDPLKMSNGLEMILGGERGTAYGHPSGLWFRNIEPTRIGGRLTFEFNMN
jgi:hypothetical protein